MSSTPVVRPVLLLAAAASAFVASALAFPHRAAASDCDAARLRAVSLAAAATLDCRRDATLAGAPVDSSCTAVAEALLADGFADADGLGDCTAAGSLDDVPTSLAAFDVDLDALLDTAPAGARCAAAKTRATAVRVRRELRCRRAAAADDRAADAACWDPAQRKLARFFAMREARGDCATTGDAGAAEALAAAWLSFVAARLDGTTSPPLPTGLAAVIDGANVELTWVAPNAASGLAHARVLRRLATAPTGPTDPAAEVVFDGTGAAATDAVAGLLPDLTGFEHNYRYAVYGCDSLGDCETTGSHATLEPTLVEVLRAGGYVLHWRHAAADVCADSTSLGTAATTSSPDWWKSCDSNCGTATARQLNAGGRIDSATIGNALDTRGIPIGRVVSSEFCRNLETAQLMDFGPAIETSQELTYFVYDEASRCADTFAMLAEAPVAGTNTALVGHAGNSCPPLSSLAWGEAAIYKPDGLGGSTLVARVTVLGWAGLP